MKRHRFRIGIIPLYLDHDAASFYNPKGGNVYFILFVNGLMMQITLNGDVKEVRDGITVRELLSDLKILERRVAVEINRELVTRSLHESRKIEQGDIVEIVTLVGGG
jgi:thiamine biosynthesis protein ThiS